MTWTGFFSTNAGARKKKKNKQGGGKKKTERYAPDHWGNDAVISEAMELEAHSAAHIETVLHKVRAQRHLVGRCLSGELDVSDERAASDIEPASNRGRAEKTRSQKRLAKEMDKQLENATAAAQARDDAELEVCIAAAEKHKMLFASGPPGTGKTFVVHEQIRKWRRKGARALFTLPTGQLASEMRAVHPHIDVDTSHGAFRFHRDLQEAAGILTQYDLSVTDEVSTLTAEQYERIVALWKYAEQLPCIVLMGDFWQLPVVDKDAVRCSERGALHTGPIAADLGAQGRKDARARWGRQSPFSFAKRRLRSARRGERKSCKTKGPHSKTGASDIQTGGPPEQKTSLSSPRGGTSRAMVYEKGLFFTELTL